MHRFLLFLGCGLAALAVSHAHAGTLPDTVGRGSCAVSKQTDVPVTMRDGVTLRADVYTPATKDKVPVILMRTQYGKAAAQTDPSRFHSPTGLHPTATLWRCRIFVVRENLMACSTNIVMTVTMGMTPWNGPHACPAPPARLACMGPPMWVRPSGWPLPPHLHRLLPLFPPTPARITAMAGLTRMAPSVWHLLNRG